MSTFIVVNETGYHLLETGDWLEACQLSISRHADGKAAFIYGTHPSHAMSAETRPRHCTSCDAPDTGHWALVLPCGHPDARQLSLRELARREEQKRGMRRIDSIAWVVRTNIRHTLNGLGSDIEQLRSDMASGGHLNADGAVREVDSFIATLRQVRRQLADGHDIEGEAVSMHETLGKDAEAMCLAHRRLVRWMPAPGWWYHARGWPRSGECEPMRRDNPPLVWVHDGRPSFMNPPTEQRLWARGIYRRAVSR